MTLKVSGLLLGAWQPVADNFVLLKSAFTSVRFSLEHVGGERGALANGTVSVEVYKELSFVQGALTRKGCKGFK